MLVQKIGIFWYHTGGAGYQLILLAKLVGCHKRLSIKVVDIAGNTNRRAKLNTTDLLIKVTCFVKKVYNTCKKTADLN